MSSRQHGIVPQVTIGAHAQTITPALAAGLKLPQDWGVILSDIDAGAGRGCRVAAQGCGPVHRWSAD